MYHTTRGLILREAKYKESDKILTILTETEGKISAKARGVARTRSKLAAATQLLCFSELTLFGNKGLWTINEATTVEQFRGLRGDIELLALGSYIAELLEAVWTRTARSRRYSSWASTASMPWPRAFSRPSR